MEEQENYGFVLEYEQEPNLFLEYEDDESLDRIIEEHLPDIDHVVAEWHHRHRQEPIDIDDNLPELPLVPDDSDGVQVGGQLHPLPPLFEFRLGNILSRQSEHMGV